MIATSVAFDVVFAAFVVAMVILAAVVIVWAVRRDRQGRRAWLAARGEEHGEERPTGRQPRPPDAS